MEDYERFFLFAIISVILVLRLPHHMELGVRCQKDFRKLNNRGYI